MIASVMLVFIADCKSWMQTSVMVSFAKGRENTATGMCFDMEMTDLLESRIGYTHLGKSFDGYSIEHHVGYWDGFLILMI